MDFSIIKKAGLRVEDFARIVGVTKGRVSQWKTNPPTVESPKYRLVVDTLSRLERAVEKGQLPYTKLSPDAARQLVVEKLKSKLSN